MNINLNAPIGMTGYGNVALNLLKSLYKDHSIALFPMGQPRVDSSLEEEIINNAIKKQTLHKYNDISVKIWHQFDLLSRIGNGPYVAYPFFELDTFTETERYHLNFPDKLMASSQWAKEVLLSNEVHKPIDIVNLGVDTSIFSSDLYNTKPTNNYVFITIGKWEIRKGHDLVIECFNRAFENHDNVELWMITNNPFLNETQEKEWLSLAGKSKLKNKIKIFPRLSTQKDLAEALSYANCGLYLSRAEGWNLELLETMAMNKPVIATNYSAHTEYCNKDNSYLIDITEKELAYDGKWFHGEGSWAKIGSKEKDQIIDLMRHVYTNNIYTNNKGADTAKQFSWENAANQFARCIENL